MYEYIVHGREFSQGSSSPGEREKYYNEMAQAGWRYCGPDNYGFIVWERKINVSNA
jgi:hypothetical protein